MQPPTPPAMLAPVTARLATLVLVLVLIVLGAGPAAAHTRLASSTPGDGETVGTSPTQLELVFTDPVLPEFARVVVSGPADATTPLANLPPPEVADATVRQPLPMPLAPGKYVVGYRVVANDGHPLDGQITFTYTPGAPGSPASATLPSQAPAVGGERPGTRTGSGWAKWGWLAGALLVVAAVVVVGRSRRA